MRRLDAGLMLAAVGNAIDSSLLQYRRIRADHQTSATRASDRVFIHASGLAYCFAGRQAADHNFLPTGGTTRKRLESGVLPEANPTSRR